MTTITYTIKYENDETKSTTIDKHVNCQIVIEKFSLTKITNFRFRGSVAVC